MQISDNNIIQFNNNFQRTSNAQEQNSNSESGKLNTGQVITLAAKKLFKNAALVDILKDDFQIVDILVEKDKIKKIAKKGEIKQTPEMEAHDLEENFVLPSFWNYYARFDNLLDSIWQDKNCETVKINGHEMNFESFFKEACRMSNLLAGNVFINEILPEETLVLENILDLDEKQLELLSDDAAKKNKTIFLHVGLSLEELGSVEKKFGKPLVQVLEDFGFLDRKWALVGGNCLEKDDFQILSQYDGFVVLCPLEDAVVGRRTLNIKMLKNLGLDVALGSGQCVETDMFEAIKHLIAAQRTLFESGDALSEKEALLMATGGKSALQEDELASFIVMQNQPTLRKSLNSFLVWESSKTGPILTVANGNILQYDKFIYNSNLEMDYFDVLEKLNEMKEKQKNDN